MDLLSQITLRDALLVLSTGGVGTWIGKGVYMFFKNKGKSDGNGKGGGTLNDVSGKLSVLIGKVDRNSEVTGTIKEDVAVLKADMKSIKENCINHKADQTRKNEEVDARLVKAEDRIFDIAKGGE